MSSGLVAKIRGFLRPEWAGSAGKKFRSVLDSVSQVAEQHQITPRSMVDSGIEMGQRKLEGLANQEYAAAAKNFAEAEQKKIEAELQRRSLESKIRREEAEARKAEIQALDAEIDLRQKIKSIGVSMRRDEMGRLFIEPEAPIERPAIAQPETVFRDPNPS